MLFNAHKASGFYDLLGGVRWACVYTRNAEESVMKSDLPRQK